MATSLANLTTDETVLYAEGSFAAAVQAPGGDGVLNWSWDDPLSYLSCQIIGLEIVNDTPAPTRKKIPFARVA